MSDLPQNPYRDRQWVYLTRDVLFVLSDHVTFHLLKGELVEITGLTRTYRNTLDQPTEIEARPTTGPLHSLRLWFTEEQLTVNWPPEPKDKT